jgi:hypothetical protein
METLRRLFFLIVACSSQLWADSLKTYNGVVGDRQAEFRLEWAEDGSVRGDYVYAGGNRAQFNFLGNNKTEGLLELNVYSDQMLTARMSLNKKTQGNRISWVGTLKGNDGRILAVSFSRQPDAGAAQAPVAPATQVFGNGQEDKSGSGEKVVKDPTNGALVWRPYSGVIQWTGGVNGSGFAEGNGTLVVFDRKGNRAAIFTGMMEDGHLVGNLTAKYPTSPDRAHYVGGYSNWAENGMGTMTYNDGKVVAGNWRDGELVAIKAAGSAEVSLQSGEPAPRPKEENGGIEPPDPDTAAEDLQKTYDKLKGALQGDALQNLKVCQRAWIKYHEMALRISSAIWDKPNDPWEGADRFDALMAWQRTRELQFITDSLFGPIPETPVPDDLDEQVALLSGQLRRIHANGNIKTADMAALKQVWDQSCQLSKLADLRNEPENQKGQAARRVLALATRNLNEVLALWLAIHQEIAATTTQPDEVIQPMAQSKPGIANELGSQKQEPTGSANPAVREVLQPSHAASQEVQNTADAAEVRNPSEMNGNPISSENANGIAPDLAAPQESANRLSDVQLLVVYWGAAILSIVALIGVFMGANDKITIYNGNWDFGLTCLCAVSAIAAAVCFADENTPVMVLFIIAACVTLLLSFRESMMANDSILGAALAVPAKFILLVLIALCALMAVGGVRSGMDELKKGNKDKAAMQFVIAALSALGARFFHNLIRKLIKERVTRKIQPQPIAE